MTHLVILAYDKDSASFASSKRCKYCVERRSPSHMRQSHPDIVEKFRLAQRDQYDKENAGLSDRIAYAPRWHLWGNRIK